MNTPYSVAVSLATVGPVSVSASAISAGDNFINGSDEELGLVDRLGVNAWASAASLCRFGNLEIALSLSLSLFFFFPLSTAGLVRGREAAGESHWP